MSGTVDAPSLLRFVLERFDEDMELIILGTPVRPDGWNPDSTSDISIEEHS